MKLFTEMFRKLTDAYTHNPDSNIGRVLLILSGELDELNATLQKVEDWGDLNNAEGVTLDLYGLDVGQNRGQATDEVMRVLIRAKIARNASDGTMDKVIQSLALSLNADPSTIKVKELYRAEEDPEPAAVAITGLPLGAINRSGMTLAQFGQIAQRVVQGGVRVATIDVTGTFQLADQAATDQQDPARGLAPVDQSTGGTLSGYYDPNQETELPI